MYAIQVQRVIVYANGESVSIQLPTFFLDEDVQGIRNEEHAVSIVRKILGVGDLEYPRGWKVEHHIVASLVAVES